MALYSESHGIVKVQGYAEPLPIVGDIMERDAIYFEEALQEYRETTGDYARFLDLRPELQSAILQRAQQLKDTQQEEVNIAA